MKQSARLSSRIHCPCPYDLSAYTSAELCPSRISWHGANSYDTLFENSYERHMDPPESNPQMTSQLVSSSVCKHRDRPRYICSNRLHLSGVAMQPNIIKHNERRRVIPGEMSISAQNNAVSSWLSRNALNRDEKLNIRSTNVEASSKAEWRLARDTMGELADDVGRNMTSASPSMYAAWMTHATYAHKYHVQLSKSKFFFSKSQTPWFFFGVLLLHNGFYWVFCGGFLCVWWLLNVIHHK